MKIVQMPNGEYDYKGQALNILGFQHGEKLSDKNQTLVDNKIIEIKAQHIVELKSQAIEDHIYESYPERVQAQDNGWVTNFTAKLKAGGVNDIESQVVGLATLFLQGKKLKDILKNIDAKVKPMYEKLVKVAIKNEWSFLIIQEGKKAIAENREPVYPEFPKFD